MIARFGDVVVLIADAGAPVTPLIEAVKLAADAPNPGAALAEHVAPLLFGGALAGVPFGAVAPTADGLLLLLRGKVAAESATVPKVPADCPANAR